MSGIAGMLVDGGLSVSASPPLASGSGLSGDVPEVTAIAAGGVGGYTYAWTILSNTSGYALSINAAAAATTGFVFDVADGATGHAVVRCTVTSGSKTATVDVNVTYRMKTVLEEG